MGHPRPRVRAARKPYLGAGEGLGPPGLEESGGSTLPSVGRNHDRYLSTRMKYAQSEVRMWRVPGSGWKSKSVLVCGSGCRPGCGLQWPQGSNQCTQALGQRATSQGPDHKHPGQHQEKSSHHRRPDEIPESFSACKLPALPLCPASTSHRKPLQTPLEVPRSPDMACQVCPLACHPK